MSQDLLSVSELNLLAQDIIEANFPLLRVEGEISNLTYASSGHVYFTLKDQNSQVRCTIWSKKASNLSFRLKDGQLVEVQAAATLYKGRGEFQLNIEKVSLSGQGNLYQKFIQTRDLLNAQGVFAPELKRKLPAFPRRIVIITSRNAAALQDVLQVLRRRAPHLICSLYHVAVQGEEASGQIINALSDLKLSNYGELVLLCRGGGSIEDLWCFNDEKLAFAIRNCALPVISGVGHETDTTIADFAADVRAPTPSAAAEMICPERDSLLASLAVIENNLQRALTHFINEKQQKIDYLEKSLVSPKQKIQQQKYILHNMEQKFQQAKNTCIQQKKSQLSLIANQQRFILLKNSILSRKKSQLDQLNAKLSALDPLAVLNRGYALVQNLDGKTITNSSDLQIQQELKIQFSQGSAIGKIVEINQ